jgi:hypothetical protein
LPSVITGAGCSFLAVAAAVAAIGLASCSSSPTAEDDAWSAAYVNNPDLVWAAILLSLEELGYEVEEEDRLEGTIRAVEITDPPYRGVTLNIDQIQRTEVVRVHVRPSAGSAGGPESYRRLDEAVREFLNELDSRLGRRPPS